MSTIFRSRIVLVAVAVVILVGGSAVGVYIHNQSSHSSQNRIPAAARPSAPPAVNVGASTVKQTAASEFLTIASTAPGANATGVALNAPITINFNLPVDPETVGKSANILPAVAGSWAQGQTPASVQFTPSAGYAAGNSVSVVIHSGLASRDGFTLESDYQFGFVTQVASDGVVFQSGYWVSKLLNAQSGRTLTITLQTGDQVPQDLSVKTYKAPLDDLLQAFVYDSSGNYSTKTIDTSRYALVDTQGPVGNNGQVKLTQPDGIYVLVASDATGQFGSMWLDISKYGVLLRQDDQHIVVAGQDLTSGDTTPQLNISFLSLKGKVVGTTPVPFTGTASFPAQYPLTYDMAVATLGDETVIVPMTAPATDADIKVTQDLSGHSQIYITTDRAAYSKGDTVKFAGIVRLSNDQQYSVPAPNTAVHVWMEGGTNTPPVDLKVTASADGTFSGSFLIPAAVFNTDGTDIVQELYANVAGKPDIYPLSNTTLVALGPHAPSAKLTVTFDKPEYVLKDTIKATIAAVTPAGAALAGQSVTGTIFVAGRPAAPSELGAYPAPSTWGSPWNDPFPIKLDSTGHATYSFSANITGTSADQQLTLEVTYGTGAAQAVGARTAVVYQAADEVYLLPSRAAYTVGETVVAPFVVETRAGDRIPNAPMAYELDRTVYSGNTSTTTVVVGGNVTTDANGLGLIRATYNGPADGIVLKVKGNDAAGNTFQDTKWLNISADVSGLVSFNGNDVLVQLAVAQDKIAYKVGDTANLTVTAPADENVLLSLERGRIHQYKWLALKSGDNALQVNVTPDLAPGFSVMFSYFRGGAYVSEGLPIQVNTSNRLLKVAVTSDKTSYTSGQTAQLTVTVTDGAGKPVAATLFADGYDAIMSSYKLVDAASIGNTFFWPGLRATNGSSSLVGVGNWGGRCGGGAGGDQVAVTLAGKTTLWSTGVLTDATTGQTTVSVPLAALSQRIVIIASTPDTGVGQAELDLNVA